MSIDPINEVRSSIYQLLSSLFAKEIDSDRLKFLTDSKGKAFWQQLALDEGFKVDIDIIVARLNELNSESEILELAADYCNLFLMGGKKSASPYASLYVDESLKSDDEIQIFGEQHQKMTQFLQRSQLQVESKFPEPADHIAVVLAYIANQCTQEQPVSYAQQLSFISDNLADWIASFVAKVEESDQGHFYSALARLTQSWIMSEQQWLIEEAS